jgi:hypothetical protein
MMSYKLRDSEIVAYGKPKLNKQNCQLSLPKPTSLPTDCRLNKRKTPADTIDLRTTADRKNELRRSMAEVPISNNGEIELFRPTMGSQSRWYHRGVGLVV